MKKLRRMTTYLLPIAILAAISLIGCAVDGTDTTAPTAVSTEPADEAINVGIASNITIVFGEAMDPATINATTFTLTQGTTEVFGSESYNETDMTATFNPESDLVYSSEYTATINTDAMDTAGNPLADNKVWSFTTLAQPDSIIPTVESTYPTDTATEVSINTNVTVTFSEAMSPSTIITANFMINGGTDVAGEVTYDIGNKTAIFSPNENLSANTTYSATVTTAVTDSAGNQLETDEVFSFTTISVLGAGPEPVSLRTAGNFVVLAKAAISTVPTSTVTGDIGLSPASTSYITGFSLTDSTGYATSPQVTGFIYAADMATPTPTNMTTAISDMETAFTDAAGRSTPDFTDLGTGEIGGMTLIPGLYKWGTGVRITTNLTLNGGANDVWIFQIGEGLTVASGAQVLLNGGAQAKNIFWQMAGEVTLNTTSHMEGTLLSQTAINLNTGASINGRLLAQTAVNLDQNAVTQPAQ